MGNCTVADGGTLECQCTTCSVQRGEIKDKGRRKRKEAKGRRSFHLFKGRNVFGGKLWSPTNLGSTVVWMETVWMDWMKDLVCLPPVCLWINTWFLLCLSYFEFLKALLLFSISYWSSLVLTYESTVAALVAVIVHCSMMRHICFSCFAWITGPETKRKMPPVKQTFPTNQPSY